MDRTWFLGALLVRSVESALSEALGYYWLLAFGVLFILTVVLFPAGLFGRLQALRLPRRMGPLWSVESSPEARSPLSS